MCKKILFFPFYALILLTSCSNNNSTEKYNLIQYIDVHAFNIESDELEVVSIDYDINNPEDVFILYSIDQNYLPVGYTSECYANVCMLDYKIIHNDVYYIVDDYILNVSNLNKFNQLLSLGVKKLGYKNAYILYNNALLTKNDKN